MRAIEHDPTYWKRFQVKTPIAYLPDIVVRKGQESRFQRSWKRFWNKYPQELNSRERRFDAFINRIQRERDDKRYCNRVQIRYVSKRVGYGVFAEVNIPPYSLLNHYAGVMTHDDDITEKNDSAFSFSDFSSFCIDATKRGNWTRFMNHAEDGSPLSNVLAWEFYRPDGPRIVFTAGPRGIKKGAQLLYSYGEEYWKDKTFKVF